MQIKTITGATSAQSIKIQTPTQFVGIVVTGKDNNVDLLVSINRVKNGSVTNYINKMKVTELSEMLAKDSDYFAIECSKTGSLYAKYMFELARDASLNLSEDDYLLIEFSGMDASSTYDIYSIGYGNLTERSIDYTRKFISQGQNVIEVNTKNYETLHLPDSAIVEKIQVQLENGKSYDLSDEELRLIQNERSGGLVVQIISDQEALSTNAGLSGYKSLLSLDLQGVELIKVFTDGTEYEFYMNDAF